MAGNEKLLPQNVEAEAGVLGSILIDPDTIAQVADLLRPEDFYREAHRVVFQAALDLYRDRGPADLITLTDELARRGKLDDIGGASYVSSLANQVPTSRNARHYAQIVERTAVLRRLLNAAGKIAGVAYDEPDADDALAQAFALLGEVTKGRATRESVPFGTVLDEILSDLLDVMAGKAPGIHTGFPAVDNHTMGFVGGELIYLCARPGMAKSALAQAIAIAVANECADRGTGCVEWVTLEMRRTQQGKRVIASLAGIDTRILRAGFRRPDGSIDRDLYAQAKVAVERLRGLNPHLYVLDTSLTIGQLRTHLTRAVTERGCVLGIVDYLGLMRSDSENAKETDYQRISAISRELKQIAIDLNIPILALSQLNRQNEQRVNKRPFLSEMRDSGGTEQDADWVFAIHRQAYYDRQRAAFDTTFAEFAELLVLKARDGMANVTIPLRFEGPYTRFSDWPADQPWPDDATRAQ